MSDHYDYNGNPISLDEWCVLFESDDRLLKQEWIHVRDGERFWISTVYLGIDHNHMGRIRRHVVEEFGLEGDEKEFALANIDERPWVYETMAFKNEARWFDVFARMGDEVFQIRDATQEEALASHEAAIDELRS